VRDAVGEARRLAQEREQRLLRALQEAGEAGLSAQEAALRLAIPDRALRRAVERLVAQGAAERRGGRWHATAPAEGVTAGDGPILHPAVDRCLSHLPTEAHRAFVRLLLAAVVAKRHLHGTRRDRWPSFAVHGPTMRLKTAMGLLVADVFRLPRASVLRVLGQETGTGSLFGRRVQRVGRWTFAAQDRLRLPLLVLDEMDKASREARTQALLLCQGDVEREHEGATVEIPAVVMTTFNLRTAADVERIFGSYYRRRSVVLDVGALGRVEEPERVMRAVYADLPRLPLDRLRPAARELPEATMDRFSRLLHGWLTPEGDELTDAAFLDALVLGWSAFGHGLDVAAVRVAIDYLVVTDTLEGHVRPGYRDALLRELAGVPAEASAPLPEEEAEPEAVPDPGRPSWADLEAAYCAGFAHGAEDARVRPSPAAVESALCKLLSEPPAVARAGSYTPEERRAAYAGGRADGRQMAETQAEERRRERERAFWLARAEGARQGLRRDVEAMMLWSTQ